MRKLLPMLLFLLVPAVSFGQGSIVNDIALKNLVTGIAPAAGATVTVCTSAGTGIPCTPLATVYSNIALTVQLTNPLTADSNGYYSFFAAPGTYIVTTTGAGVSGRSITYTLPFTPSSGLTGAINCTIINAVRCISPSNPQIWTGADPVAWMNSAYANCAAASLVSCPIQVAAGTYPSSATLLNFSTLGVFPQLQCAPETVITFSATSGTAITLNPGRNGVITDWGISGCHFVGSGLGNTLTGILSGGTNGAVGAALRGIHVNGFNIGLTFGTNVQGWLLDHSSIGDNNQQLVLPAGQTQTGEQIIFQNSTFFHSTAWSATCISIANAGATIYNLHFIGGSIDECGVTIGNGSHTVFNQVHFENPVNVAVSSAFATCTGGVCDFNGDWFTSEQTSFNPGCSVVASCFLDAKGGAVINAFGNQALNSGLSAMSGFIHICATCTGMAGGNSVGFGTQPLPQESVDTGGTFARITGSSVGLYGGNNSSGSFWIANSGATVGGVTGTFMGCLQPGVANSCSIDTSGNLGMAGALNAAGAPVGAASEVSQGFDATTKTAIYNANNNGLSAFSGAWNCTNVTPVTLPGTSTTNDQNLMACTIPAGTLNRVGRTLRVKVKGIYSTPAASSSQMTLKLKLCTVSGCGSGTVIAPIAIQSTALGTIQITNDNFSLRSEITTQTAGASSAYEASGEFLIDLSTLATAADSEFGDTNVATVGTIDSTAQLFLQTTLAFSIASASNVATQRQLIAETVN